MLSSTYEAVSYTHLDVYKRQDPAFASYFVDHTTGIYPTAASGFPWTAASIGVKGDPICDLTEDMVGIENQIAIPLEGNAELLAELCICLLYTSGRQHETV